MEYKNEALEELQEKQIQNMAFDRDRINDTPEMQKIYDELDNRLGDSSISEIFNQEMGEELEVEESEAQTLESDAKENETEAAEDVEPEDEFPELTENEEVELEDEVKEEKRGKGDKAKYLLTKENHRRLKQLQEKEEMLQEMERRNQELAYQNEQLRHSEAKSWETAVINYEHNVKNELARGRAMYELAVENGDKKAELDALEAITDAKAKLRSVESYTSQKGSYAPETQYSHYQQPYQPPVQTQAYQQNYQPQPQPQPQYLNQGYPNPIPIQPQAMEDSRLAANKLVSDWFKKHNIIDEHSIYFDEGIKNKVVGYAQRYEQALKKSGKANMILSDSYFNKLDGYIESEVERMRSERQSKKPSTAHIGSVKGAAVSSNSKPKIDLTLEELKIINSMNGDTEKIKAEWLRHKASTQTPRGRR